MRRNFDRWLLTLILLTCLFLAGEAWLHDHPQHDPWAPLDIDDPAGWATGRKIAGLRGDVPACRAFLERSDIDFEALAPTGTATCRRDDRLRLKPASGIDIALAPAGAQASCPVFAGLALWVRHGVEHAAADILGSPVVRIEHFGTANCRRIGGGQTGTWSEHATGNAIDIAAFVLKDGRRITVLRGWQGRPDEAEFLHAVRDSACEIFGTVLSPDYNAAHVDHFHLDQASRPAWSVCR